MRVEIPPTEKNRSVFLKIISAQCIFVTVILLGILIIKFVSPKTFSKIKFWHDQNFLIETSVSEVLDGEKNED